MTRDQLGAAQRTHELMLSVPNNAKVGVSPARVVYHEDEVDNHDGGVDEV